MHLNAMQEVCCRQLLAKWPPSTPEVMSSLPGKTVCADDISAFEYTMEWEEDEYDASVFDTFAFGPLLQALQATGQPCRYLPPNADSVTAVSGLCRKWFV